MRLPGPNLNLDRTSVRFNRFRFRTSVQNRTSASLGRGTRFRFRWWIENGHCGRYRRAVVVVVLRLCATINRDGGYKRRWIDLGRRWLANGGVLVGGRGACIDEGWWLGLGA